MASPRPLAGLSAAAGALSAPRAHLVPHAEHRAGTQRAFNEQEQGRGFVV